MPVKNATQISALKCTKSVWRLGTARTSRGSSQRSLRDSLAGFRESGMDTGKGRGKTGGRGQLRRGKSKERRDVRGKERKGGKKREGMEGEGERKGESRGSPPPHGHF